MGADSRDSVASLSVAEVRLTWVLTAGVVLPLLDGTLVNLAVAPISLAFGEAVQRTQWVVTVYALAAAVAVTVSAWLVQTFGTRRTWLGCLVLFFASTVMAAVSSVLSVLLVARIFQGIAAGVLLPVMQMIVIRRIGKQKSKAALAAMSVPSVLVPMMGPLLAGWVLSWADWHDLFWLQVPVCVLAIACAWRGIPEDAAESRTSFDLVGFLMLAPGLVVLAHALHDTGHGDSLLGAEMVLASIILSGFAYWGFKLGQRALLDVRLWGVRSFMIAALVLFMSSFVYYGGVFAYPLILMQHAGYSAGHAGLLLSLHGLGALLGRQYLPAMSRRWGGRRTGLLFTGLALAGSLPLVSDTVLQIPGVLGVALSLRGAGVGVLTILAMATAYDEINPQQVPHASAWTRIVTHFGGAVGPALVLAVGEEPAVGGPGEFQAGQFMMLLVLCGIGLLFLFGRHDSRTG